MKKTCIIISILLSGAAFSQLSIGIPAVSNASVSIEFGNENRGIILPWVSNQDDVTDAVNGTIIYDVSDHKIKVKYATGWKDLTVNTNGTTVNPRSTVNGYAIQQNLVDNTGAKVGIGVESDAPGILVLENSNQAMVLPKVASPHLNILNPTAGLMVFDTNSGELAIFNGSVWSFWKHD